MIVIGSGGGTKLVSPVAKLGYKVAIIEKEKLGGTCLNRGCIPSKMLIHIADIISEIEESSRFELKASVQSIDFPSLIKRVNETINEESESIKPAYDKNPNIDLYQGHAKFINDQEVQVNGQVLKGEKILIATGADAAIPDTPGLAGTPYMTYCEALTRQTLPKSMLVLGAGYIATELGYFYGKLGCDVTFLVRSNFIKHEDQDVIEEFTRVFSNQFKVIHGTIEEVHYSNDKFTTHIVGKDGQKHVISTESFLAANGIAPNTSNLGLENTSVELTEKGFVKVDDYLKTTAPNIYALGDCVGRYFFRHNANFEGEYLFNQLFQSNELEPIHYHMMPHAVFTNPQVASVGMTEQEAIKKGINYVVGKCPYHKSAMGMALKSDHGFVKLIFDKDELTLIGAHVIGYQASVMIHMPIAFMQMKATLHDLLETVYIHPALCEIVRNAARDAVRNFR